METLRACALTCRSWKPRAQLYLFQILRVNCSILSPSGVDEIAFLLDRNVPIRSRVSVITARGESSKKPSKLHLIPLKLPVYTRTVHELRLGNGQFYTPPGTFPSLRQFRSITKLTLVQVTLISLADLRRTISSFLALDVLRLIDLHWFDLPASPTKVPFAYPPSKVRLSSLVISAQRDWLIDVRSIYLLEWFTRAGMVSRLQYLNMVRMLILDSKTLAAVQAIMEAAHETLLRIWIGVGPHVNFGACTYPRPQHVETC